jgi:D-sedoheptulose 7-phosphate isomerase
LKGAVTMLGATLGAKEYFDRVCREIQRLDLGQIDAFAQLVEDAYHAGKFVFVIGNGGSGANASHLC